MTAAAAFIRIRPVYGIAAASAALLQIEASPAQTVERFSLSLEGAAGVASNPFLANGEDNQSSYVELDVAPALIIEDERGSLSLEANLRGTQYSRRFGGSYSYSGRLAANRRLSEYLSISAGATTESSVIGERTGGLGDAQLSPLFPGIGFGDLVEDPVDRLVDSIDSDLGLLGEQTRRNALSADLGLDYRPYPADRLRLDFQAARSSFPGQTAGVASRNLSANVQYARSFGTAASLGVSASVAQTRFQRGRGTSTVYQPQISYSGLVYPSWSFSLAVGASIIRSQEVGGRSSRSGGLSGDVRACRRGARLLLCLSGARSAEDSGRGAIGQSTSASAQINYPLSERETLSMAGTLAKIEQSVDAIGITDPSVRQQSLDAIYQLRLHERWEIGVTAGYRDVYRAGRPIEPDFTATATLRVGLER